MNAKFFKPVLIAGVLTVMFSACSTESINESGEVASISESFENNNDVEDVVADFLIDAKPAKLMVRFESASSGATSYKWSFPNGNPSSSTSEVPPIVKYAEAGEYTVILEVTDGNSTDTHSSTFQL